MHKLEVFHFFNSWKKEEPQTNDITVFGMQI